MLLIAGRARVPAAATARDVMVAASKSDLKACLCKWQQLSMTTKGFEEQDPERVKLLWASCMRMIRKLIQRLPPPPFKPVVHIQLLRKDH